MGTHAHRSRRYFVAYVCKALSETMPGQHRMSTRYCRLRKWRKSAHLLQREVAYLIGLTSQSMAAGLEAGIKRPGREAALAAAAVFDVPITEIFPGMVLEIDRQVFARACELHRHLQGDTERAAAVAYLAALIDRLKTALPPS